MGAGRGRGWVAGTEGLGAVNAAHAFLRRRGWAVFKVQRPLRSTVADPPWLFTEEGGARMFELPASLVPPTLRELMADRPKRLVLARPVPDGGGGTRLKVRGVSRQEAERFQAGAV